MTTLTIDLPSSIVYVAGHVNDVLTVFVQDAMDPSRWRAHVDAAEDSLYHISLEMHDEAGNIGYFDKVVEYILPVFVYDRVQADIDRVHELRRIGWQNMTQEQREEWMGGLKGCLNTADLKRIENDIYVIADLLEADLQTGRDNLPELPDDVYFDRMLGNVRYLRGVGYVYSNTPQVPDMPLNTYQKINDVEHILHDIYEVYNANHNSMIYCGDSYHAGEQIGLL